MNLRPIEANKKTIAAIVQERIREAILAGEIEAGSRIDQVRLAERLDVSLVPIREALKKLEAEGFVKILPRRGAFVTSTSIKDIEELYAAREIIEGGTAYQAASKLSATDLDTLRELISKMEAAIHTHDLNAFMKRNREFHFIIYNAIGSVYVTNMIESLWDLAERYRYHYVFQRDQGSAIARDHQAILTACINHDAEALRAAIIYHMQQTMNGIKHSLQNAEGGTKGDK